MYCHCKANFDLGLKMLCSFHSYMKKISIISCNRKYQNHLIFLTFLYHVKYFHAFDNRNSSYAISGLKILNLILLFWSDPGPHYKKGRIRFGQSDQFRSKIELSLQDLLSTENFVMFWYWWWLCLQPNYIKWKNNKYQNQVKSWEEMKS